MLPVPENVSTLLSHQSFCEAYAILLGLLAGRQVKEILSQLKHSLPAAMWSSWRFWPFVHMVGGSVGQALGVVPRSLTRP